MYIIVLFTTTDINFFRVSADKDIRNDGEDNYSDSDDYYHNSNDHDNDNTMNITNGVIGVLVLI